MCARTCVAELTGHQSHCGKWKWSSGGETPGGRLGINSRICDALWSAHLREKREEGEGKRASGEGTKLSRRELFSSPYRAECITDQTAGHLSNAEKLNSEDLTWCQESFKHRTHRHTFRIRREQRGWPAELSFKLFPEVKNVLSSTSFFVTWMSKAGKNRAGTINKMINTQRQRMTQWLHFHCVTQKRQETQVLMGQACCDKITWWSADLLQHKYRF